MNCEEFKQAVGADPDTTRGDVLEHAASCAACARYRTEMIALNGLIHRALRVEVTLEQAPPQRSFTHWRVAAMILVSVIVFSIGWLAYPRASLAEQVVDHVLDEAPSLLRSDARVERDKVREVLNHAGVYLASEDLPVSYATVCKFRKHEIAHLVVQTDDGPVTVLVLPNERSLARPQRFDEQGFAGTFVPAPRGVIAVLAREAAVDEVAAMALKALRYEI